MNIDTTYYERCIQTLEVCERFLEYRENRNNTAHDYGVNFALETLALLPDFIRDARLLAASFSASEDETS